MIISLPKNASELSNYSPTACGMLDKIISNQIHELVLTDNLVYILILRVYSKPDQYELVNYFDVQL